MAYCYILYSEKLTKFYIGACNDLSRRCSEHNSGHSKFTKTGIPWTLVHSEPFPNLPSAKKREMFIKKKKSRLYILSLLNP
ncbi:MAG: GIY-YIG nuclease family protein [Saprospiraceae bacterium]|nr:GIY-YIG nuclease family protein [Saprospiraceae bacterium]MBK7525494.1 GIY-YIG nuclease family protein [Saprospiraceae bacterium]MBK8546661.1 GIY-YIG nuclease family protein [Saprospiraceae bacterium]